MKSKLLTLKSGLTAVLVVVLFAFVSLGAVMFPSAKADEPTEPTAPPFINLKNGDLDIDYDAVPTLSNRLWQVESDGKTSYLRDGVDIVYAVKNDEGDISSFAGGTTDAPGNDKYVAYTGEKVSVKLNPNYTVNVQSTDEVEGKEYKISELIALAGGDSAVTYTTVCQNDTDDEGNDTPVDDDGYIGDQYVVNMMLTTAVIDFGTNAVLNQEDFEPDISSHKLVIKKYWNIVTINNVFRSYESDSFGNAVASVGFTYSASAIDVHSPRPEHGDTVVWTIGKMRETAEEGQPADDIIAKFAVKFQTAGDKVTEVIHKVNVDGTVGDVDPDHTYFGSFFEKITAVSSSLYYLDGSVAEVTLGSDTIAWWDDKKTFESGSKFAAVTQRLKIEVAPLDVATAVQEKLLNVSIVGENYYNGAAGVDPYENTSVVFGKDGELAELVRGVDYELAFKNNVNVGDDAELTVVGMGNFTGTYSTKFTIAKADNAWATEPNFIRWSFGGFDRSINLFRAVPKFGAATDVVYTVYTDRDCTTPVYGMSDGFKVNELGAVDEFAFTKLNALSRGAYYLVCTVEGTNNYGDLRSSAMQFNVTSAMNSWVVVPTIKSWTEGGYDETENAITVQALFGNDTLSVYVYNSENEVVYESKGGKVRMNDLASLGSGFYTLTARVEGTSDYSELVNYSVNFQVFEKPGLPGWAIAVIVIGVVLVIAIVLIILWRTGVLTVLTGDVMLRIRTNATVDATLAAVRANKRAEEAKASVAEAKAREAKAARKAAAAAERAKPAEEKAAALEAKAKAQAERAERMRARAEAMQARAERLREQAQTREPAPETPAEEAPAAEAAATEVGDAATSEE